MNIRGMRSPNSRGMTLMEAMIGMGITVIVVAATGILHVSSLRLWQQVSGSDAASARAQLAMVQMEKDIREGLVVTEITTSSVSFTAPKKTANGRNFIQSDGSLVPGREHKFYRGSPSGTPSSTGSALYTVSRPVTSPMPSWNYDHARLLTSLDTSGKIAGVSFMVESAGSGEVLTIKTTGKYGKSNRHYSRQYATSITLRNNRGGS